MLERRASIGQSIREQRDMRRCLIIANQTLTSDTLERAVRERIESDPHEFYIVAPATLPHDQTVGSGGHAGAPSRVERAQAMAEQRLARALDEMRTAGAVVQGEVGDEDPVPAVSDALSRFPADEIIVSTLPGGLSRWLRRDVLARLRKAVDVPVVHLEAEG